MTPAWVENTRLLLRMLRGDPAMIESALAARRAPLAEFADFAGQHSLAAVAIGAMAGTPLPEPLPEAAMQRLERSRERMASRAASMISGLEQIAAGFRRHGQRFLLLKGPYLATRLYGSPHGREYYDLDLLVPLADRDRALNLMGELGYECRSGVLLHRGLTCFFVHGFDFARGDARIDLHWRLSRHPSIRLEDASIWERCRSYSLHGESYEVLADEHELVFACLSLLRDIERGKAKLKNVVDLLQWVGAMDARTDWYGFVDARRRDGTHTPTVRILALCLQIADAAAWWPQLTAALGKSRGLQSGAATAELPLRFDPLRFDLGNKLWAMRAYDASPTAALGWWAASLPFRIAAHRQTAPPKPTPARAGA